jgi:hypothetical protein
MGFVFSMRLPLFSVWVGRWAVIFVQGYCGVVWSIVSGYRGWSGKYGLAKKEVVDLNYPTAVSFHRLKSVVVAHM